MRSYWKSLISKWRTSTLTSEFPPKIFRNLKKMRDELADEDKIGLSEEDRFQRNICNLILDKLYRSIEIRIVNII